jgi:hypothetical protein
MKDLQPYKNKIMELTYEEKMQFSVWLQDQIDLERGDAVKEKMKEVGNKVDSFLNKAAEVTKTTGNSLLDQFKDANK